MIKSILKKSIVMVTVTISTLLVVYSGLTFADGKKIVKWVDEKGVTHYGDVLPSQYNNKSTVLNTQGLVLKTNSEKSAEVAPTPEQLEQAKNDKALLASYTTEKEIDLALERHLQADDVTIQSLQVRKTTLEKQLEANKKSAEGFTTRKKPVPADLTQEIQTNQAEISHIDAQIKQQKDNSEAAKKRFSADKQRFVELKGGTSKP